MAKLNPESAWEFADAIKSMVKPQSNRRKATVQSVDKDGTIWVSLPGSSTVTPIQSTGVNVSPGDTVLTELRGTSLHITENQTNPAIGENTARSIAKQETQHAEAMAKQAKTIADEANAVAQATNQHFFADDNGAHITDVTQDEWTAAVADNFSDYDPTTKPYHNQLLNSLGILLRTALNNLVSITRSAIAFYDGAGNGASNIVASFGSNGAQIGKSGEAHLLQNATNTRFCDSNGIILASITCANNEVEILNLYSQDRLYLSTNGAFLENDQGVGVEVAGESVTVHGDLEATGNINLSGSLAVDTYTKAYTAAANSLSGAITIDITKTGYTPLGIVGFACGSSGAAMEQASISGTTATLYIRNVTTSAISRDCTINVLYTAVV